MVPGFRLLVSAFRFLVSGCWILIRVSGFRLLAFPFSAVRLLDSCWGFWFSFLVFLFWLEFRFLVPGLCFLRCGYFFIFRHFRFFLRVDKVNELNLKC